MATQSPSIRPPPPSNSWTEHRNAQGRVYWYNQVENKSVWEKPFELKTARERAIDSTPWKEYQKGERKYYVNSLTKESSWTLPKDLKDLFDRIPDDQQQSQRVSPIGTPDSQRGTQSPYHQPSLVRPPNQRPIYTGPPPGFQSPDPASLNGSNSPMPPSSVMSPNHQNVGVSNLVRPPTQPQSSTKGSTSQIAGGIETFTQMLRDKGVDSTWTWEQTMRQIITEVAYKALGTLAERKAAFNEYLRQLEKEQEIIKREKVKEIEPLIRQSLEGDLKSEKVQAWLRYEGMLIRCSNDSVWKRLEKEVGVKDAQSLWEKIRKELREEERQQKQDLRRRNKEVFLKLLQSFEADVMTRWKDARQTVLESDEWKSDAKLRQIELVDMIDVFDELIRTIEQEKEQEIKHKYARQRRQERQRRDWLRNELQIGKQEGWLTVRSTFGDVYEKLKSAKELQEMLGQPGSTPLDLFFDVLDELEIELNEQANTISKLLEQHQSGAFRVSESSNFKDFKEALHISLAQAGQSDLEWIQSKEDDQLQPIFEELVHRCREENRRIERKLRHLGEDFRYALKKYAHHHPKELGGEDEKELDLPWSEWKSRLIALRLNEWDAYECTPFQIESERIDEARQLAWQRFVERQKQKLEEKRKVQEATTLNDSQNSSSSSRKRRSEGEHGGKSREVSRKERRAGEIDDASKEKERREHRSSQVDEPSAAKRAKTEGEVEEDSEKEEGEV